MPKWTKRLVDSLAPEVKERIDWDDELGDFGLRIYQAGRKVYVALSVVPKR